MKKIRARQLILKKYSCYGLKKFIHEFDNNKKNSRGSKILLPPITFLMVRPLVEQFSKRKNYCKNIFTTTMCNVYQSK